MARRRIAHMDPIDRMIEDAFQPGEYTWQYEAASLVHEIGLVEAEIANLVRSEPARAVRLYETLLAGCDAAAEEIDDSDGDFGTFAGTLFPGWIKARQAAGLDCDQTVMLLLKFMEEDNYGFCNDLTPSAVKVLDRAGLAAFEREGRARLDKACKTLAERKRRREPNPNYYLDQLGGMPKATHSPRRAVG